MHNQINQQPQQNMSPTSIPQRGGHELFDSHEIIATYINILDQYLLFDQHIQDPVLKDISKRQQTFITDLYNITVQAFKTGQKPQHETKTYMMKQDNGATYGIQPSQPKKPNSSVTETKDAGLSAYMLGLIKSTAGLLSVSALEMTNPVLRRVVADSVSDFIEMGYEIFLYQNQNQYYQVPTLSPQDAATMLNSYTTVPVPVMPPNQNNQQVH
ncbi:spore gernimation protein GerQ [Bacillus coahuilensis p1.1.43]|uniref:Spore gernimation protein GerQ n=1 Tax=Bacillus coahuilensis p1.1.43 TaxID=1150625 RepID=A0A147K658_9BACI|nr:spore gernimation protein GerQ [Bacillus coahuilensis p1.1.43]